MRIIGFCDFEGTSIKEQVETAKNLNINSILLRQIRDLNLFEIDDSNIKQINKELKDSKVDIFAIDPLIPSYDLYDMEKYEENIINYEKIILLASKLKVDKVIFRLPIISNIIDEFTFLKKQLDSLIEISKKNKVTLLIQPEVENTNTLVYILKKYKKKEISLIFDPRKTLINKESPIVAYRLLKDYFEVIVAADLDKKDNPELLGYGRVSIIDLFKRMNRDQYKGNFILDDSFSKFINKDETKKVPWYKKLLSKSNNIDNYLRGYSLRIFPNEEERDVTIYDIYENQINVLKIAFQLRD